MNIEKLFAGLNLHKVRRFQTYLLTAPKSVAEHSARVAMLYSYLGGKEVLPALMHDAEESITSDIPGPLKKHLTGLEPFVEKYRVAFEDPKEKDLCKLADLLELVLDLIEQQLIGNSSPDLMAVYEETLEEVLNKASKLNKKTDVKKILKLARQGINGY